MLLLPIDLLKHIREEAAFITAQTGDMSLGDLENNLVLQRALEKSLEIVGEATKRLDTVFCKKYPYIDWKAMVGIRYKLVHDYFDVDLELMYNICKANIPDLLIEIDKIIDTEENAN